MCKKTTGPTGGWWVDQWWVGPKGGIASISLFRLLQTTGPSLHSTRVDFNRVGLYRLNSPRRNHRPQRQNCIIQTRPRCGSRGRMQSTTASVCTKYPPPRRPTAASPSQQRPAAAAICTSASALGLTARQPSASVCMVSSVRVTASDDDAGLAYSDYDETVTVNSRNPIYELSL